MKRSNYSIDIRTATKDYEKWLADFVTVVPADIQLKHRKMQRSFFGFFRATFYRWIQLWPEICHELNKAPNTVSVGDLHIENFGTWRDQEGRLAWGINDFDEAFDLPWTNDLVRLTASAFLAIEEGSLGVDAERAGARILAGYLKGLRSGGFPFVMAQEQTPLYDMVRYRLRDRTQFWQRLNQLRKQRKIPKAALNTLRKSMPGTVADMTVAHRVSGIGSLGRQRFVALARWQGGIIAREVKARAPSACIWARGAEADSQAQFRFLLKKSIRSKDPFLSVTSRWVVRRLSPDCARIDLNALPKQRDEELLLEAMGMETANVHLAGGRADQIISDLHSVGNEQIAEHARKMIRQLRGDWTVWRK